jgi:hypothetical protein
VFDDHDIAKWEDDGGAIDLRFDDEPHETVHQIEGELPLIEVASAPA